MTTEKPPALLPYNRQVFICTGPRCAPGASEEIYKALKAELKKMNIDQKSIRRAQAHCFGICQGGPLLVVYPEGIWYHHVTHEKLARIMDEHLLNGKPILEWTFGPKR